MVYRVYFKELSELANSFNDAIVNLELDTDYEPIDYQLDEGIEVGFSQVDTEHQLLSIEGRQILLYIKDHGFGNKFEETLKSPEKGNRFHVAYCTTLKNMEARGRIERYVATNNVSGEFTIAAKAQEAKAKLRVCQNCLKMLNYKGSKSDNSAYRHSVEFDLTEFFATYSSFFRAMPKGTEESNVNYSESWSEISKRYREKKNYTCEKCRVNLSHFKSLCHTHHINGVKSDNSETNLQVLCADCHRKEHIDHMFVSREHMQTIAKLRYQQGIGKNVSWDEALKLVDPVFIGDLEMARDYGYEAPYIHYKVNNLLTGEEYFLDAAWPKRNFAVNIEDHSNIDLELYGFRSFISD